MEKLFSFIVSVFLIFLLTSCGKETLKVAFDLNGGVLEEEINVYEVKKGNILNVTIIPKKENHVFIGWYNNDELFDLENDKVNSNMNLTAKYELIKYQVIFDSLSIIPKVEPQYVSHGSKVEIPEINTDVLGNTFLGWYKDDELYDFNQEVTSDLLLTVKFEKDIYTVSFITETDDVISDELVTYNDLISEPLEPNKEYAAFLGWYYEGRKWNFNTPVTSNMTLTARWNIYYDEVLDNLKDLYINTLGSYNFKPLEDVELISEINGFSVVWESSNPLYFSNEGKVTLPEKGSMAIPITLTAYLTPSYKLTYNFEVLNYDKEEPPVFTLLEDYEELIIINWNDNYDPLKGIKVIDVFDGDITYKIEVLNTINTQEYGLHTVTLKIENSFGKTNTLTRNIKVNWDYDITFIGHAGSYYGLMNSEEAIMYAIEVLKYQAIEVDLKQTKDGVFVLSHDDTFGNYTIANTSFEVLKDVTVTQSRSTGYPSQNGSVTNSPYTAKLLTLEKFLQICKLHNVDAVIELKSSPGISGSTLTRMQAFLDVVEENDMLHNIILLGSNHHALIWTRNNGYEYIPCQYLVSSIEYESILDTCIENNLDVSFNVTYDNGVDWIARYKSHNIKIAAYTFSQWVDYNEIQSWIDKGVDFVTTDWHVMSELNLPLKDNTEKETFKVTFKDYDGSIKGVVDVVSGNYANAPIFTREGYTFTGFDKPINNITSDLTVTALYEINNYSITYDANTFNKVLVSYNNKEEFVNEFYSDFYEWLLNYGKDVTGITVSGNNVNINLNGVNETINSVEDLKLVGIYEFEKTFGNLIYKPFNRPNNLPVIMDESNSYFLNTSPYKVKYENLDAYFLNAILNNYTGYDNGYNHASNGRVQIMFRFHQWQQGTNIKEFNSLPEKVVITDEVEFNYILPETHKTYTINDSFILPVPESDIEFLGWYLDLELTNKIEEITKGMTGNIKVYAKWNL